MSAEKYREFVEEVRSKSDISIVVGEDASLSPHGGSLFCLSPLRKEKTASFSVMSDRQAWHDFGTGEGGDVFKYIMRRDRVTFHEAVMHLARRASVTPYWLEGPASDLLGQQAMALIERRSVEEMLTESIEFYHQALPSRGRAFLMETYGFTDETIDKLKIGWAPGDRALSHYFLEYAGYSREAILKTGLFVEMGHGGKVKDFFCRRFIFPYWYRGAVVYAIGRRHAEWSFDDDWELAKYKKLLTHSDKHPYVSPTVSNEWFWGEDCLRARLDELIITEGVTDAIAAWQAGRAVVSPVTTSFRKKETPKLIRITERVGIVHIVNDADVLPDGRKPGEEGALRTATDLHTAGRDVRIGTLPRPRDATKIDLNEFLRDKGNDALGEVLAKAKRYPEHLIDSIPDKGLDPAELEAALRPVAEVVASTPAIQRDAYIRKIAKRFHLAKATVTEMISGVGAPEAVLTDEEQKAAASRDANKTDEEKLRGRVHEELGYYYTKNVAGNEEIISSFSLRLRQRIVLDSGELLSCDALLTNGKNIESITFPKGSWTGRKEFLRALPSPDMQWTGSDDNVQGVLRIVATSEAPARAGTTNLGYHEGPMGRRWVWAGGAIAPSGPMLEPDVLYVPTGSSLAERVQYVFPPDEEVRTLARAILPALVEVNEASVVLPILGWFYSVPFKPRIMKALGHFPNLLVWGTHGSGKTSIIKEIFWLLFGVVQNEPYSCTETEFALLKQVSATNSIPVAWDEFKPRDMGRQRLERYTRTVRRAYSGEVEERGRADQSVNKYGIHAPMCTMGEANFEDDPALIERTISVSPDKNYIVANERARLRFNQLRSLPLAKLAGPFMQWTLSREIEKELEQAKIMTCELIAQSFPVGVPPRVQDNLATMVFGVRQFQAFAESLGVELPKIDLAGAFFVLIRAILEGEGANVKDVVDGFTEELSTYAHRGVLKEDVHYAMFEGKLALHLPSCHHAYISERRSMGREDDTNGIKALRRVAKEKIARGGSYVVEVNRRVAIGDQHVRCLILDMNLVPPGLDFEPFPARKERTWGGKREYKTGTGWGPGSADAE